MCFVGGVWALASLRVLCSAGWQGQDAQPKKESAANDDGYHWRKCAFRCSAAIRKGESVSANKCGSAQVR